jgi:hypothetical protein
VARHVQFLCVALLLFAQCSLAQESASSATTGILTSVGVVDPLQRRIQPPLQANPVYSRSKGAHRIPLIPHSASDTIVPAAPEVAPTLLDERHTAELLRNFNGVSSRDSGETNFDQEFEPPDQGLCVGNGFVVEPVNSAFTFYRTDGSRIAGPFNVNDLFNEGALEFTSDPRCYFDKTTDTWFASILFINVTGTEARTDIAVNSSGDPTTPWTVYHLDATDDGTHGSPHHPGCPCLGDQPLLGIDRENVYISTNEFSILGPQFNGAQIYAISKSDLISNPNKVHFAHFSNLFIGGAIAASVQPAITSDDSGAEYLLNSLDPFFTFDDRIGVWAITNEEAVADGKIPTLSSLVITVEAYGVPPSAVQRGSTSQLNPDDDRMQQVQFIHGELWGALDTAVTIPNDAAPRAGAAWFKIEPRLDGQHIGAAELKSQGYVASLGNYLLYPAIQASPSGTVAMVLTLSGPSFFPSAAYSVLSDEGASFGPIKVAASGTGPYDPKAGRWGDYSAAVLDSSGQSFWLATEYIPPAASQTPDRLRNWGTRVLEVTARDER